MAIKFSEFIKGMKQTTFNFTSFERCVTTDDEGRPFIYLLLTLDAPIEKVTGSVEVYEPGTRRSASVFASDVATIKCPLPLLEQTEDDWQFDMNGDNFTGSGKYSGDLFLDVSRKQEVWLTEKKFSKFSQEKRIENKKEAFQRFFKGSN